MDESYCRQHEPFWGEWTIVRKLGEGSFGQCFEIEKKDIAGTFRSALKIITVPQQRDHIDSVRSLGMTEVNVKQYFTDIAKDIAGEFITMERLKGNSNIVSYEDHSIIEHEDGIGCDILIRMELLTPCDKYFSENGVTEKEVIRLGIDICRALELCEKNSIIHRDIKPANIFISHDNNYKLGDFGIAKTMQKTCGEYSRKGTPHFMAPEVDMGKEYDGRADIFSLGVVMYYLLNDNRIPFLPSAPNPVTHNDFEIALEKRAKGEIPPPPAHAGKKLTHIILKACSSDPEKRYVSACELRESLENLEKTGEPDIEEHSAPSLDAAAGAATPSASGTPLSDGYKTAVQSKADVHALSGVRTVALSAEEARLQREREEAERIRLEKEAKEKEEAERKQHEREIKEKEEAEKKQRETEQERQELLQKDAAAKSKKGLSVPARIGIYATAVALCVGIAVLLIRMIGKTEWKVEDYEPSYPFYAVEIKYKNGERTSETRTNHQITKYSADVAKLYVVTDEETDVRKYVLYISGMPTDYTEDFTAFKEEEWVIEGIDPVTFREYARRYTNGQKTDETELTGVTYEPTYYVKSAFGEMYRIAYADGHPIEGTRTDYAGFYENDWFIDSKTFVPDTYEELAVFCESGVPRISTREDWYNDESVFKKTGVVYRVFDYVFYDTENASYYRNRYVNGTPTDVREYISELSDDEWMVEYFDPATGNVTRFFNETTNEQYAYHYYGGGLHSDEWKATGVDTEIVTWNMESDAGYTWLRKYINGDPTEEIIRKTPKVTTASVKTPVVSQPPSEQTVPSPYTPETQTPVIVDAFDTVIASRSKTDVISEDDYCYLYCNAAGQVVKKEHYSLGTNKEGYTVWIVDTYDRNGSYVSTVTKSYNGVR